MPKFICPYDWQKDLTTFMKNRTPKSGQVLQAVAMDNWATKLISSDFDTSQTRRILDTSEEILPGLA